MLNHIRIGKLVGWRPRGYHERAPESCMSTVYLVPGKRGDRDLPLGLSARRKKVEQLAARFNFQHAW